MKSANFLRSLNMNTAEFALYRCKSINILLLVKPTLMSLFWLFGLCVCVCCLGICVFGLFGMYESSSPVIHKLGCIRCRCGIKENILNFALPSLCLVYMKFLMPLVIKLNCKLIGNSKWKYSYYWSQ